MKLKRSLLPAFAAGLLLFSCKKNDTSKTNNQNTCKIDKVYTTGTNGTRADSATYSYTGNNVTKIQWSQGYETFDYSGQNISKRNFFATNNATTPVAYDQISYNSDGTVSKIDQFQYANGASSETNVIQFTYASGKLTKVTSNSVSNGTVNTNGEEYNYSWTGSNITTINYVDHSGSQQSHTANVSYDTNANYFTKQSAQAWLTDPSMAVFSGDFLPLFISANNPTQIQAFFQTATVTYQLDSHQNVTQVTIGGNTLVRYTYNCQ